MRILASQQQRGQLPCDERSVARKAHTVAAALLAADGVAARGCAPVRTPIEVELCAAGMTKRFFAASCCMCNMQANACLHALHRAQASPGMQPIQAYGCNADAAV